MQLHSYLRKSLFSTAALASAALGGFLFFAGAPQAQAAAPDNCERRIAHANHELREAIEDHGYYSRQANHWRHERREAYERCRDGYSREYRDRDDRGYDRDRDRY